MVRLKQRYLLLNILYPSTSTFTSTNKAPASSTTTATDPFQFHAPTPDYVSAGGFVSHLRNHITLLFGDFGLGVSLASLKVVYFSTATSTIILRVPRNHHRLVWAALTYITELPAPRRGEVGKPCVVRVVRVSGTIRKAEEELIRRARRDVVRAKLARDGEDLVPTKSTSNMNNDVEMIQDLSADEDDDSD